MNDFLKFTSLRPYIEETDGRVTPRTSLCSLLRQEAVVEGGVDTEIFPSPRAQEKARNFSKSQSPYGDGEIGIFPLPESRRKLEIIIFSAYFFSSPTYFFIFSTLILKLQYTWAVGLGKITGIGRGTRKSYEPCGGRGKGEGSSILGLKGNPGKSLDKVPKPLQRGELGIFPSSKASIEGAKSKAYIGGGVQKLFRDGKLEIRLSPNASIERKSSEFFQVLELI